MSIAVSPKKIIDYQIYYSTLFLQCQHIQLKYYNKDNTAAQAKASLLLRFNSSRLPYENSNYLNTINHR